MISAPVPARKHSSALYRHIITGQGSLLTRDIQPLRQIDDRLHGDAAQCSVVRRWNAQHPAPDDADVVCRTLGSGGENFANDRTQVFEAVWLCNNALETIGSVVGHNGVV